MGTQLNSLLFRHDEVVFCIRAVVGRNWLWRNYHVGERERSEAADGRWRLPRTRLRAQPIKARVQQASKTHVCMTDAAISVRNSLLQKKVNNKRKNLLEPFRVLLVTRPDDGACLET